MYYLSKIFFQKCEIPDFHPLIKAYYQTFLDLFINRLYKKINKTGVFSHQKFFIFVFLQRECVVFIYIFTRSSGSGFSGSQLQFTGFLLLCFRWQTSRPILPDYLSIPTVFVRGVNCLTFYLTTYHVSTTL